MNPNSSAYSVLQIIKADRPFAEIVEDLNSNFKSLVSQFALQGLSGNTGASGSLGPIGKRGASFVMLDDAMFLADFPLVTESNDITIEHINEAIATNPQLFFENSYLRDDAVHLDLLILPSGHVIEWRAAITEFATTTLQLLVSNDYLTKAEIVTLIQQHGGGSGGGVYTLFGASNKVISDDAPNAETINIQPNASSVPDVTVDDAGVGVSNPAISFIAMQEALGITNDIATKLQFVSGYATDLHAVIQQTIASGQLHHTFVAAALPVHTFIQNDNSSGMLIGNKNVSANNYGHIRRTDIGLELMPFYTRQIAEYNEMSRLFVSAVGAEIRGRNVVDIRAIDDVNMSGSTTQSQVNIWAKGQELVMKYLSATSTVYNDFVIDKYKTGQRQIATIEGISGIVKGLSYISAITDHSFPNNGSVLGSSFIKDAVGYLINNALGWQWYGVTSGDTVQDKFNSITTVLADYIDDEIANLGHATTQTFGVVRLASDTDMQISNTAADGNNVITEAIWKTITATETRLGTVKVATTSMSTYAAATNLATYTDDTVVMTPRKTREFADAYQKLLLKCVGWGKLYFTASGWSRSYKFTPGVTHEIRRYNNDTGGTININGTGHQECSFRINHNLGHTNYVVMPFITNMSADAASKDQFNTKATAWNMSETSFFITTSDDSSLNAGIAFSYFIIDLNKSIT